jgi:hypothetical protein
MEMESREASTAQPRRYKGVNAVWPDTLPPLTAQEAVSAAKRLYRAGRGKAFKGPFKVTSGRRYTTVNRKGEFLVNASRGWHDLVHDISHLVHYRMYPNLAPHHPRHMELERKLAEMAIKWLDGSLRREKPKSDPREVRHQRVLLRIKAWESKLKRAENALKKLYKTRAYYEKTLQL